MNNNNNSQIPRLEGKNKYGIFRYLASEEYIGPFISAGNVWEEHIIDMMKPFLSKDQNLLDIGAHIGCITIPLARECKNVICFEPQRPIYDVLTENVIVNDLTNVSAYHLAVGHAHKKAHISTRVPDGVSSGKEVKYNDNYKINFGGIQLGIGGEEVEMITLDSFELDPFSVMKVDVEGCEPLVFYGTQESIRENRPVIFYENNYKKITAEIRKDLAVTPEQENFSIEAYCAKLGYQKRITLLENSDYILVPDHDMSNVLRSDFKTPYGTASFYQEGFDSYAILKEGGRTGKHQTYRFGTDFICVDFKDDKKHLAHFREGKLHWDNGTEWWAK